MLNCALVCLLCALVAAIVGFSGDGPVAYGARVFYLVCLLCFLGSLFCSRPDRTSRQSDETPA